MSLKRSEKILKLHFIIFSLSLSFLNSNDDHYRTGTRFSGVDMNAARLLFHKLIQSDHPQISQQVCF